MQRCWIFLCSHARTTLAGWGSCKSVFLLQKSLSSGHASRVSNSLWQDSLSLEGLSQERTSACLGSRDSLAFLLWIWVSKLKWCVWKRPAWSGIRQSIWRSGPVLYEVTYTRIEGVEISTCQEKLEFRDYLLSHPEGASLASLLSPTRESKSTSLWIKVLLPWFKGSSTLGYWRNWSK